MHDASSQPSRPNLFRFAYAEHAQDAVLAWLLTWADPGLASSDPGLHAAGHALLVRLLGAHAGTADVHVDRVEVRQQAGGIDVMAVVNGEVAVVIEDKVDSPIRKEQLDTYVDRTRAQNHYPVVVGVFVKTGDQDPAGATVEEAGHPVLLHGDVLQAVEEGVRAGARHDALLEYRDRLLQFEADTASYAARAPEEWGRPGEREPDWDVVRERRSRWAGFFTALQAGLPRSRWGYVPNPTGGFMGLWWAFAQTGEAVTYLQLEDDRLVFKVIVDDPARRGPFRWFWHERVLEAATAAGLDVGRPKRFGSGATMTVAELVGDYRRPSPSGLIDVGTTLDVLRHAHRVLESARARGLDP